MRDHFHLVFKEKTRPECTDIYNIEKSIQFIEMKGGRFVLSNVSRQKSKGTPFHEDRKCHNYLAQSKLTSFSLLTRMNMFIQINRERKRTNISFLSISISKFYFQYAKSICLSKNKHNLHDKLCLLRSKRADASWLHDNHIRTKSNDADCQLFSPSQCLVKHRCSVNKIALGYVWYRIGHSRITSSLTTTV